MFLASVKTQKIKTKIKKKIRFLNINLSYMTISPIEINVETQFKNF